MDPNNFYCLRKKKSVLRGVQHLIQIFLNTFLLYHYYYSKYSLHYYFSYQFQLLCSVYYHFSSDCYKYNIEHEILLQKLDHLGINIAILVGIYTIYERLFLQYIFIIHLLIVITTYFITKNLDLTSFTNITSIILIIPWYLVSMDSDSIMLLFTALLNMLIGIYFYFHKKYKFYYNNIYIFGHHELYHLFTSIAVYIWFSIHI